MLSINEISSILEWVSNLNLYQQLGPKKKAKVAQKLLNLPYKLIGKGYKRIAYDLENGYVLKVALSEEGLTGNVREYTLYSYCSSDLCKYLCPVMEIGQGWIIMENMHKKVSNFSEHRQTVKDIKALFKTNGIIPRDLKKNNLALSETEEIVIIDYGNFRY